MKKLFIVFLLGSGSLALADFSGNFEGKASSRGNWQAGLPVDADGFWSADCDVKIHLSWIGNQIKFSKFIQDCGVVKMEMEVSAESPAVGEIIDGRIFYLQPSGEKTEVGAVNGNLFFLKTTDQDGIVSESTYSVDASGKLLYTATEVSPDGIQFQVRGFLDSK